MTRDPGRGRLFTRAYWAMMALSALSVLAAIALVAWASRHPAPGPRPGWRAAPLAAEARGAKRTPPDSSLGPP
jgi:hypothetical protein